MEKVCPFCGKPVSDGDTVCPHCGKPLNETAEPNNTETTVSDTAAEAKLSASSETSTADSGTKKGAGRKIGIWIAAAAVLAGVCYAARQSSAAGVSASVSSLSASQKQNPVSGDRIVAVTKPLYVIKEDTFAYTNIHWAEALCPEIRDYIPEDIPDLPPMADNNVTISGSSIRFDLAPLAGITPVVFSDLGNGSVSPASIPDEEIEVVYGYRDEISLYGTITEFGSTKELDPAVKVHYGKYSGWRSENKYTNNTVYYINGTIDRVQNKLRPGSGFTSGYKETVYHHDGMYVNMKKSHDTIITYPGITQDTTMGVYDHDDLIGTQDVTVMAYSRFQILYFPDTDTFQVHILLLDQGTVYAEGSDGNGRHEEDSSESDFIYDILLLSDYTDFRTVDEDYDFIGESYVIVER